MREPLTGSSLWADHCALSRKGRGRERGEPCILAKRTQRILLGSSPRKRGPTVSGYGSRLSARFAGVGRDDNCVGRARDEPAVAGNDRRLRSIVSGLLFTMNGATRTCDAGIRSSSETLAYASPRISHCAGAGVGRGVRGELAVELGEEGDTVGEAKLGAG